MITRHSVTHEIDACATPKTKRYTKHIKPINAQRNTQSKQTNTHTQIHNKQNNRNKPTSKTSTNNTINNNVTTTANNHNDDDEQHKTAPDYLLLLL